MAQLPGWDRARLATADPRDVEAARLLIYASARAPEIRFDIDGAIETLRIAGLEGDAHKLATAKARTDAIRDLKAQKPSQTALRELLELDVDDDAEETG